MEKQTRLPDRVDQEAPIARDVVIHSDIGVPAATNDPRAKQRHRAAGLEGRAADSDRRRHQRAIRC